ncbi:MAG: NADH-quinone oxidoreductase subunit NuoE [Bacteroidetes bacterium]|nr:NADH-quinone oxidoreductase subunit NuoE [Bacteroidota bacterium]
MKFDAAYFSNLTPGQGPENLIRLLQEVQLMEGYISAEAIAAVSLHLRIPENKIIGVMSFYRQFRVKPAGKLVITACNCPNCHLNGGSQILAELENILKLKPGQTGRDKRFTLLTETCLGGCGKLPVIRINDTHHKITSSDQLRHLIDSLP